MYIIRTITGPFSCRQITATVSDEANLFNMAMLLETNDIKFRVIDTDQPTVSTPPDTFGWERDFTNWRTC